MAKHFIGPAAVAAALGASLAACTSTDWVHPELPFSQWSTDVAGCRSFARAEVEKEKARYGVDPGTENLRAGGTNDDFRLRLRAQREIDRLADECLERRGYIKGR